MKEDVKEIIEIKQKSDDNLAKIAISKEADRALVEILNRVSAGFDSGRATKQDLTSHIIMRFTANCTDKEIHDMRSMFFDPILAMEAKLRKAKDTGVVPESIRIFLFEEFMASSPQPNAKRAKKPLNTDIIKDNVSEDKETA
jgi:hypothetical protein